MPFVTDDGAGHFIEICLRQAGFFRRAGIKTLHDLDVEIGPYLVVVPENIHHGQTR